MEDTSGVGVRAAIRSCAVIVAMAIALLTSGPARAYLWCPGMERVMSACCCKPHGAGNGDAPAVERARCCEGKAVPEAKAAEWRRFAASGALPPALPIAERGLSSRARVASTAVAGADLPGLRADVDARAGPRAPLPILHCALLI